MKKAVFSRLAICACLCVSLTGCYYAIPTMVEAVNQNLADKDAQGDIFQAKTGPIKFDVGFQSPETIAFNRCAYGYNSVMTGDFSLVASYQMLLTQTLQTKKQGLMVFPKVSGLSNAIYYLKLAARSEAQIVQAASATAGTESDSEKVLSSESTHELSRAAAIANAITALEKLQFDEKNSLPYFRQHYYRYDGGAGAKQVLPIIQGDYEKALDAMEQLGEILFQQQLVISENRMQYHYDNKALIAYQFENSLYLASRAIATINVGSGVPRTIQMTSETNAKMRQMLQSVKTLAQMMQSRKLNWQGTKLVEESLRSMYSHYSAYQREKTQRNFNKMMSSYAQAIKNYNDSTGSEVLSRIKQVY